MAKFTREEFERLCRQNRPLRDFTTMFDCSENTLRRNVKKEYGEPLRVVYDKIVMEAGIKKEDINAPKIGRGKIEISEKIFQQMCELQSTQENIADFHGCNISTIQNWCNDTYGCSFSQISKRFKEKGKLSLRESQFKNAIENESAYLQMFLGKNYLGQSDSPEIPDKIDDRAINMYVKKEDGITEENAEEAFNALNELDYISCDDEEIE